MCTADVDHCWVSLTTFDAAICFHIDDRLVTVCSTNVMVSFCMLNLQARFRFFLFYSGGFCNNKKRKPVLL